MEPLALSPFSVLVGPIFVAWEPEPLFEMAVSEECMNTGGRAHGGYLAAVIDICTGQGVKWIPGNAMSLVTASTSIQYLSAARIGERLNITVAVERSTDALVFASCRVAVDQRSVALASFLGHCWS